MVYFCPRNVFSWRISLSLLYYGNDVIWVFGNGLWTITGGWSSITPMALAHSLNPIRSKARNKYWILWFEWCVSSSWLWFWSVYSIYCDIHTMYYSMYYSCILSNWNQLFLWDINKPRVDVVMTACQMIHYCYSSNVYFNCIVPYSLYSNVDTGSMWRCAWVSCTPS